MSSIDENVLEQELPIELEVEPDEYFSLKEDFSQIIQRGIKSFQEETPGRTIENIIVRLQGRHGVIVQTNERGLLSIPEMSGIELDNQGNKKTQRMFMGMNCSITTKGTSFTSVNLLGKGQTSVKEFEANAATHEIIKKCVKGAQTRGEKIQQNIDEQNFQYFSRYTDESCKTVSSNLNTEGDIPIDRIFKLITLARQTIKSILGKKLDDCKIVFFSVNDCQEIADLAGGKADIVVTRTGLTISAKTDKGNDIYGTIRGTGGLSALTKYNPDKTPEEVVEELAKDIAKKCVDIDRAQSSSILEGEAYILMAPEVVGVLAHEVYGHASECDIILDNKHDKDVDISLKSRLGGQVSENDKFHIVDDGGFEVKLGNKVITNCYGSLVLDDDGIVGKRTYLVKNGIQQLVMNSADTFNEIMHGLPQDTKRCMKEHGLTGNYRSQRFDKEPMVRMSNTFVLPDEDGPNSLEEMAQEIPANKKGVLLKTCTGGWVDTSTGDFQVTGHLGYLIENGLITDKPVKNIIVRGNISKFGSKIKLIGSSKTITDTFSGWCGKDSSWVPVEGGGPAILIEDASVGKKPPSLDMWSSMYKEYAAQMEEVACNKRKKSEIYLRFIEDNTEEKIKNHSHICLVTSAIPAEDEIKLLCGREMIHSEYTIAENGMLSEEKYD